MHRNHNLSKILIYAKFVNLLLQCIPEISRTGFSFLVILGLAIIAAGNFKLYNLPDSMLITRIIQLFY